MTIEIIGCGAMGMLFGARLALSGSKVRMWARTSAQAELLNKEGINYTDLLSNTRVIPITCISGSSTRSTDDTEWILLGVKQTAIDESMISLLNHIATPHTPVICIQNGIGHMEKLRTMLPGIPFIRAVSTEGALRTGQNSVSYTGKGSIWIEEWSDNWKRSSRPFDARNEVISRLQSANMDAQFSDDMDAMVLRKLLVNSVINPLSAIYGFKNGQLPVEPLSLQLMKALFAETQGILEAAYGGILGENLWEYVLKVCDDTANNESSMLSDVRAHRQTEVKWINGGVLELAHRINAQAPLNNAMVALVESLVE
jgi:2-dehydropantoate 2-reductase